MTDYLYKSTKLITETEIGTFVTQFINCKKGVSVRCLRRAGDAQLAQVGHGSMTIGINRISYQ